MKLFHSLSNAFFAYEISANAGKTCFLIVKLFHSLPNAFFAR